MSQPGNKDKPYRLRAGARLKSLNRNSNSIYNYVFEHFHEIVSCVKQTMSHKYLPNKRLRPQLCFLYLQPSIKLYHKNMFLQ